MEQKVNINSFLILGISLVIIGFLILIGSVNLFKDVFNVMFIILLIISIKNLISFLLKKNEDKLKLLTKTVVVILSLIACIFKDYSVAIIPIVFAIYLLINSIANLFNFTLLKLNKLRGGYSNLLIGLTYLFFGIVILFSPLIHLNIVLNILGIYSILLGINSIFDYIDLKNYIKIPRIKVNLPFIIEALIPISVLQKMNKQYNEENNVYDKINKKDNIKPDIEILIHVTEDGYGKLGHLDICYNDEIISFGNYDPSKNKLNGVFGSGVVFIAKPKLKYIRFCIEDTKKTLFVFGLKLTEKEREDVEKRIKKIKEQLKEWNPPYLEAKLKKIKVKKEEYKDYSSRIYKYMKPQFYKFKSGKYIVFFILKNNCVSLANKIIGPVLNKHKKMYGILTPGTYYDYLEREYMKKNSIVVTKKIYNKYNIDKYDIENK